MLLSLKFAADNRVEKCADGFGYNLMRRVARKVERRHALQVLFLLGWSLHTLCNPRVRVLVPTPSVARGTGS
jgi:hypothetical protein